MAATNQENRYELAAFHALNLAFTIAIIWGGRHYESVRDHPFVDMAIVVGFSGLSAGFTGFKWEKRVWSIVFIALMTFFIVGFPQAEASRSLRWTSIALCVLCSVVLIGLKWVELRQSRSTRKTK